MVDAEKPEAIGHRLTLVREVYGMKQFEFAQQAGIQPNTYNQYEQGKHPPSVANAIKLCKKFNITLDYIYLGKTEGLPLILSLRLAPKAS